MARWVGLRLALLLTIAVFGLPFLWMIAAAFDGLRDTEVPWPREPTWAHMRTLFDERGAGRALRNSAIVATGAMVLATAVAVPAGFGLSRLRFGGKRWLVSGVLLLQTFPLIVTMVPIYDLAWRFELQDRYAGLIVSHAAVTLPFLVWLMKGFSDAVPRDPEQAAWVDGASPLRALVDIALPAALPGIAVTAGFAFTAAWSELMMAVILLTDYRLETLPFQFYSAINDGEDLHVIAALSVLYVTPPLLLWVLLRRWMVRGMVESTQAL